jgi:hypothetical protein
MGAGISTAAFIRQQVRDRRKVIQAAGIKAS